MFLYFFLYVEIIISSPGFLCSVSSHSVYNSYIRYLWLNDLWGFTLGRNHFVAVSVTMLSQNIVFMQSIWEHTLGRCHINSINVTRFFQSHVIKQTIWEYTLWRSLISVANVARLFPNLWNILLWNLTCKLTLLYYSTFESLKNDSNVTKYIVF